MRFGLSLPQYGFSFPSGQISFADAIGWARRAEHLGFDSVWVSDHFFYSFARYGADPAPIASLEPLTTLAGVAAVTDRVRLGTLVLCAAFRHPALLAKAATSISLVSGGRLDLGLGAGWLAEEFEALNVPFATRGGRTDEWIALLRACWTGRPGRFDGVHYTLPDGVLCYPTPLREVPILVGGTSGAALRRAGRIGQGWVAHQPADRLDPDELAAGMAVLRASAHQAGRDPAALRVVLRLVGAAERHQTLARALPALARAGVTEVVVDTPWDDPADAARVHDLLRAAAA
jgi:probable F420-dependent oxidoreductase